MIYSFVTLHIKDMEKSLAFYRDLLGLQIQSRHPTNDGELAFLGEEGKPMIELVYSPRNSKNTYKGFNLGFEVESLEESTDIFTRSGYKLLRGPVSPNESATFAIFSGPDGEEIELIEHK